MRRALASIAAQEDVGEVDFEVIVVDNGSTDDTALVCREAANTIRSFRYHYDEEPGQLTGRHKGIELSNGDIISFLDDDVRLNARWIASTVALFVANADVSMCGGPCLPDYQVYPPSWIKYFWQNTPYGGQMCLPLSLIEIGVEYREIDPLYIFGLNYTIRRKDLLELGGFNPDCIPKDLQQFQGDGETGLSMKARSIGLKAMYSAGAFLYHEVPAARLTPAYFEKWFYYSGVCQSYTELRAHSLNGTQKSGTSSRVMNAMSKSAGFLRKLIKPKTSFPPEIEALQARFSSSYHEGYAFHQSAFKEDKSVREWVLKTNYWDYNLPRNRIVL